MEHNKKRMLLYNIKQLVQVSNNKSPYIRLKDCNSIEIRKNSSIVVDINGVI